MSEDKPSCPFCEIAQGRAPATILAEEEVCMVIAPLNPCVEGHVLVIPRLHVEDFTDNMVVAAVTMAAASRYARNMGPCNLITSRGKEATQSVFHLHIHLVPRRENDGLHLPWTGQNK